MEYFKSNCNVMNEQIKDFDPTVAANLKTYMDRELSKLKEEDKSYRDREDNVTRDEMMKELSDRYNYSWTWKSRKEAGKLIEERERERVHIW